MSFNDSNISVCKVPTSTVYTCSKRPQSHHQDSGTMKTKELSKQVREKVVDKYRSALGYKKISETLNIPRSTIKPIIKMERKWHHNKPAKRGLSTKTHGQGKEGINQRGNKETKVNPEGAAKLHSGDWSRTLHSAGLYGRVARKSNCFKKKISKHIWCSPKACGRLPKHMEECTLVRWD